MMKPYYQDDYATIYHGDCRDVMPELSPVELIVTDPPYGLKYNDGDLASQREKVFGGNPENAGVRPIANDADEDEARELLREVLVWARAGLLKGGCCCCCCGGGGPRPLFARWTLMMDEILNFKQAVVWDKGGLGMGIHFRRNYEFVLIAQNGAPLYAWNGGNSTPNVWRLGKIIPSKHQHPTEKPESLMGKCVDLFSHPGDTVLDPFMGSGATLVAAKNLGRKSIGIEIEEKYCEIAVQRLSQGVLDLGGT